MLEFNKENLIEAIRFDVDYHCPHKRQTLPSQGRIDKELYDRLEAYSKKENRRFPPGMRKRIFSTFGVKGTIENHQLFDEAVDEFSTRLKKAGKSKPPKKVANQLVVFG